MKREESREPGSLHFHYDREKRRESLSDRMKQPKRKGFLRGNRSLLITLLDLSILLILFAIVWGFFGSGARENRLEGYQLTCRAVVYNDQVLVSLRVAPADDEVFGDTIRASFRYPGGTSRTEVSDILPSSGEDERVLRAALPLDPDARKVEVDVYIGESSKTISSRVDQE